MWWVRFFGIRLLRLVLTLLVASFLIFCALELAPGSPLAALSGGRTLSPEAVEALTARYNLDEPFLVRYFSWLGGIFQGDFGVSIGKRQDVSEIILGRALSSVTLVLMASFIIIVIGVGLGIASGLRDRSNNLVTLAATAVMAAIPAFVGATLLLMVFSATLGWFPALGTGDGSFTDLVWHLVLPAVALSIASIAIVARVTRAAVREELGSEHVQTAVSRGIPYPVIVRRHVVRNAGISIVTISGLTIASLIAIAAVVETAFATNGLGSYLVQAAASKDIAMVQGISLVFVTVFVLMNVAIDVIAALLDPRTRLAGATS